MFFEQYSKEEASGDGRKLEAFQYKKVIGWNRTIIDSGGNDKHFKKLESVKDNKEDIGGNEGRNLGKRWLNSL